MKRFLLFALLLTACRENPSPESQAITTAAETVAPAPAPAPVETATAPAIAGPKLLPVDEAPKDPSLVAFRNELLAAVRRRDVEAVVTLSDPKIRTSFGDGGGADELRRMLQEAAVIEDLEELLTQGGKFQGESFWAPYVYSAWPDSHDAFQFLAVTGENIPLRDSPDANARAIATLSHDIVERVEDKKPWLQIKTADGHTGWVEASAVRSPVGYRAGFLKMNGSWKMNALVAGD